jgi:hypothetical protein
MHRCPEIVMRKAKGRFLGQAIPRETKKDLQAISHRAPKVWRGKSAVIGQLKVSAGKVN